MKSKFNTNLKTVVVLFLFYFFRQVNSQILCSSIPSLCEQGFLYQNRNVIAPSIFTWTGLYQYYTAPPSLLSLEVNMWGGDGGGISGAGAFISGGITFTTGEKFRIIVGRSGSSGLTSAEVDGAGGVGAVNGGGRSGLQRLVSGTWEEFATAGGGGAGYGCYMGGNANWNGQSFRYRHQGGNEQSSSTRIADEPSSDCGGSTNVGGGASTTEGGQSCCGHSNGGRWAGGSASSASSGGGGGGGWYGGGAGGGPGGGGSSYTGGLTNPTGSSASWSKTNGWKLTDAGLESSHYVESAHGRIVFIQTIGASCPAGTYMNATFRIRGDDFIQCAPCAAGTFSHQGASKCSNCSSFHIPSSFMATNRTCIPNTGLSGSKDVVFYFSGTETEGYSHFSSSHTSRSTTGLVAYNDGAGSKNSFISIVRGGRLGVEGGASLSLLPQGDSVRSVALWIRANPPSPISLPVTLLTWGADPGTSQPSCSLSRVFGTGSVTSSKSLPLLPIPTTTPITSPTDVILHIPPGGGAARMIVAELGNHRILSVSSQGFSKIIAGTGVPGFSGDGGKAVLAQLDSPCSLASDTVGNVFIAERYGIRKINVDGAISLLAGDGSIGPSGNGGPAVLAGLSPVGLALDANERMLFFSGNGVVRSIDLSTSTIAHVMGCAQPGDNGDGGNSASACLTEPKGLCVSPDNLLIVVDKGANKLRSVNLSTSIVKAVEFTGLASPTDCSIDSMGNIYVVDQYYVRVLMRATGAVTVLSGGGTSGYGNDGSPLDGRFLNPMGIFVWSATSQIYIADTGNHAVRMIDSGCSTTWDARIGRNVLQSSPVLAYKGVPGLGLISSISPHVGSWTHIAFSYDGLMGRLYVNGSRVSAGRMALHSGPPDSLTIANSALEQDEQPFEGQIADVRVYNRVLTPAEVSALSNTDPRSVSPSLQDNSLCPAGSWSLHGSTPCSFCPPGTYSLLPGSIICILCPVGTYGNRAGLSSSTCSGLCPTPSDCPPGTTFYPSSSSLSCSSNGARSLPSNLNMRLWPAAHPFNIDKIDKIIAPHETCKTILSLQTCVGRPSVVIDGTTLYVLGSAAEFNMEAGEDIMCSM